MIEELPPVEIPGHQSSGLGSDDHPMRIVTRQAAGLADGGWTDETRRQVASLFDTLAAEWHSRISPERAAVVADALARGVAGRPGGLCVEVGSGIGSYTGQLAERFDEVMAVDLSLAMLELTPPAPGHRVQADGARLPLADGSAAAVVLVNAFLFPAEVDRVLAPDGIVLWANLSAEETPIHLPPEEVAEVLPGEWDGVGSRAGVGLWCVLRRAPSLPSS
jgi:SAM-dependent methyltransferase